MQIWGRRGRREQSQRQRKNRGRPPPISTTSTPSSVMMMMMIMDTSSSLGNWLCHAAAAAFCSLLSANDEANQADTFQAIPLPVPSLSVLAHTHICTNYHYRSVHQFPGAIEGGNRKVVKVVRISRHEKRLVKKRENEQASKKSRTIIITGWLHFHQHFLLAHNYR